MQRMVKNGHRTVIERLWTLKDAEGTLGAVFEKIGTGR
jgi:hypothetical protein